MKTTSGTEKDLSGEEKVPNEVGKENVNGGVRDDLEPKEDLKDHHKDDLGSNNGHEKDIGEHDPGPKEDTAGGAFREVSRCLKDLIEIGNEDVKGSIRDAK